MATLRQKISEQILEDGEKVVQSTFVYQCRLIDAMEREYELLELDIQQLLDSLGVPQAQDIGARLELAKEFVR